MSFCSESIALTAHSGLRIIVKNYDIDDDDNDDDDD